MGQGNGGDGPDAEEPESEPGAVGVERDPGDAGSEQQDETFGGEVDERRADFGVRVEENVGVTITLRPFRLQVGYGRSGVGPLESGQLATMLFVLGALGIGAFVAVAGHPALGVFFAVLGTAAVVTVWWRGGRGGK